VSDRDVLVSSELRAAWGGGAFATPEQFRAKMEWYRQRGWFDVPDHPVVTEGELADLCDDAIAGVR